MGVVLDRQAFDKEPYFDEIHRAYEIARKTDEIIGGKYAEDFCGEARWSRALDLDVPGRDDIRGIRYIDFKDCTNVRVLYRDGESKVIYECGQEELVALKQAIDQERALRKYELLKKYLRSNKSLELSEPALLFDHVSSKGRYTASFVTGIQSVGSAIGEPMKYGYLNVSSFDIKDRESMVKFLASHHWDDEEAVADKRVSLSCYSSSDSTKVLSSERSEKYPGHSITFENNMNVLDGIGKKDVVRMKKYLLEKKLNNTSVRR